MIELHEITGKGKLGQCDLYPKHSLQKVDLEDGKRYTNNRRDFINIDIGSKKLDLLPSEMESMLEQGKKCYSCKNTFTKEAEFNTENECIRCHERKTIVNRI